MNSWPKKNKSPICIFLEKHNYHTKYKKIWFDSQNNSLSSVYGVFSGGYLEMPEGMTGEELLTIYYSLSNEYKVLEGRA